MGLSALWRDNLVNLFLGTTGAPAGLPAVYMELYTELPDENGVGGVTPATADGYAGPVDVSGSTYWDDSAGGAGESLIKAAVDFGTPTADWGPLVGAAFVEADGTLITIPEEFEQPMEATIGVAFTLPSETVSFIAT